MGDLDLYVNRTRGNAGRIMGTLRAFGFGGIDLDGEDFFSPGKVVQFGVLPVRVVIVTSIDGVEWGEAWNARTQGACGDEQVFFIGKQELVKNKRALGRRKDLADLEALGEQ